jgi:hypothetical protein
LPSHSILEYDEVKLFSELGHQVFSLGAYKCPLKPEVDMRPSIPNAFYDEELKKYAFVPQLWGRIDKRLIDWADVIIATQHVWIYNNWEQFKEGGKPVVYRTIGQTVDRDEASISRYRRQGLKIVRWSPAEAQIPGYCGCDSIIRAYKDPSEWQGWTGARRQVITIGQAVVRRDSHMKFSVFEKVTRGLPRRLYGPENEGAGEIWGGCLDYENLKKALRENRVFFSLPTMPSPYTLSFIESWIVGIPVVSMGKGLAGYPWFEVPDLIENEINGFCSDSLRELRDYVQLLLDDYELAKRISKKGRERAIELFSKDRALKEWKKFLEGLI